MRASAGLGWGAPSVQAPRPTPLSPGGVFVQPPSADAPGPRAAPPPSGGAPGGSSVPAPQFPSAPPGTPRDLESEDSDSGSSSTSAALDSSATQLAELVYEFCPEAASFRFRSSSALWFRGVVRPLALVIGCTLVWLRWSPRSRIVRLRSTAALSLCLRFYHVRSVAMRLRLRSRLTLRFPVWQAVGLRDVCGDGAVGEAIPESAGGDVFVPLDVVRNPRHVEA